jgi:hypothetical protein
MTRCQTCGAEMLPLATTLFCPNECDRIVPRRETASRSGRCPYCGTDETEPFLDCEQGDVHCLPMGHVWWSDGQET